MTALRRPTIAAARTLPVLAHLAVTAGHSAAWVYRLMRARGRMVTFDEVSRAIDRVAGR